MQVLVSKKSKQFSARIRESNLEVKIEDKYGEEKDEEEYHRKGLGAT